MHLAFSVFPKSALTLLGASAKSICHHTITPSVITPKEDLQSSSAELVYGQPLRVPGDFFASTTVPWSTSLQRPTLLDNTRLFTSVPTSRHGFPHSHVPPGLQLADYVFIRAMPTVDPCARPMRAPSGFWRQESNSLWWTWVGDRNRFRLTSLNRLT